MIQTGAFCTAPRRSIPQLIQNSVRFVKFSVNKNIYSVIKTKRTRDRYEFALALSESLLNHPVDRNLCKKAAIPSFFFLGLWFTFYNSHLFYAYRSSMHKVETSQIRSHIQLFNTLVLHLHSNLTLKSIVLLAGFISICIFVIVAYFWTTLYIVNHWYGKNLKYICL